ncbi:MAG TPA: hypothetical protein P5175_06260 [Anaerohalosphaeraceae bacterium]|nr:hypothetical protein [Anaerohalosphaeraceae bacterium]HRS71438.1 hypothetical protein [Anaerohalosphaeraceae bacterium]
MTCSNEQYENVCKGEFAELHKKLDGLDEAIRGNGKPGIQVRLEPPGTRPDQPQQGGVVPDGDCLNGRRLRGDNFSPGVAMKLAIDIADAIVVELNGDAFSEPLVVTRRVLPEYELSELKALTVTVVPKSVAIANITRQSSSFEVAIDIGIQQKIGKDTDAEVQRLSGIVSEIVTFLNRRPLASQPKAVFVTIANEPVYAPEHLSEKRLFTSVLTVHYKVVQ